MTEFYLTSRYGDCGTNVMFHKKGSCGYGTDLDELETFSLDEAQNALNRDNNSLPLLKSEVDKRSIRAVDCQYLFPEKDDLINCSGDCVIQVDRHWNGNDIAFITEQGFTYNYNQAKRFSLKAAVGLSKTNRTYLVWSVKYLDTICRRTFQRENVNTRKMITGPGIKYKKTRKPRPISGKTRHNCPACGKITWDYDPHVAAYCGSFECYS